MTHDLTLKISKVRRVRTAFNVVAKLQTDRASDVVFAGHSNTQPRKAKVTIFKLVW
jgi:hypothetical protein